jgi:hypothetical protein
MPKHWWLIDPDNPGPKQRAKAVRKAAREFGADVIFVGRTKKNTWFALVNVENPEDEDRIYKAVGGRGKLFELEEPGEEEPKKGHAGGDD